MHILLFLLLFLAAIVIFGLSIVGFVLRAIFRAWPWFVFPDEAGKEWTKWPAARSSQL